MNFTTIEGLMIGLTILVVAICLSVILKTIKQKKVKRQEEEYVKEDPYNYRPKNPTRLKEEYRDEVNNPTFCSSCGVNITGKIKMIKGDTQKTKLCKRCYRSLKKGKVPQFEDYENE